MAAAINGFDLLAIRGSAYQPLVYRNIIAYFVGPIQAGRIIADVKRILEDLPKTEDGTLSRFAYKNIIYFQFFDPYARKIGSISARYFIGRDQSEEEIIKRMLLYDREGRESACNAMIKSCIHHGLITPCKRLYAPGTTVSFEKWKFLIGAPSETTSGSQVKKEIEKIIKNRNLFFLQILLQYVQKFAETHHLPPLILARYIFYTIKENFHPDTFCLFFSFQELVGACNFHLELKNIACKAIQEDNLLLFSHVIDQMKKFQILGEVAIRMFLAEIIASRNTACCDKLMKDPVVRDKISSKVIQHFLCIAAERGHVPLVRGIVSDAYFRNQVSIEGIRQACEKARASKQAECVQQLEPYC